MSKHCISGRVNPSPETKLRLFADSAGYCNRPECVRYLFSKEGGTDYNIGEMAHIIAASETGPRADTKVDPEVKAEYHNLILLCPSCHTEIDKAPETFPVEFILNWKTNHKKRVTEVIGIPKFNARHDARVYVSQLLRQNRVLFEAFNPDLPYQENPEAEEAVIWKRKMVSQIIPNNQKVLLFLDLNNILLTEDEALTVEIFRQHIDDLIERHIGDNLGIAARFPIKMNDILKDEL